jgi:hypothetical protein
MLPSEVLTTVPSFKKWADSHFDLSKTGGNNKDVGKGGSEGKGAKMELGADGGGNGLKVQESENLSRSVRTAEMKEGTSSFISSNE